MTTAELLAPAGSYETFQAVLNAGADAVYLGGSSFGARAYADNFKEEELMHAIDEAHIHGKQLYLTVNTLFKEEELESQLYPYRAGYWGTVFYQRGISGSCRTYQYADDDHKPLWCRADEVLWRKPRGDCQRDVIRRDQRHPRPCRH